MRIGVSCVNLVDRIGGLRVYFNGLFDFLLEYDADNQYVFFFMEKNLPFLDKLKSDTWKRYAVAVADPQQIRRHLDGTDLFFCPVGILEPRPVPIPSVYTLADIQDTFFPQFFSRRSLLARRVHYKGSVRMADRIITISDFSKNALVQRYGTDPRKVARIYLSAEADFFVDATTAPPPPAKELPARYVFYPANRWKHKNHGTLLEAIRILTEDYHDDVSLVLTGDDPENGFDVSAEAARLGMDGRVVSLGFVDRAALIALYRNAVCLCYPSLFEGFGIPLVEAMACGCPVVCSNTTSMPEVVGDAALTADPPDAPGFARHIHALITDEALRADLAEKGRLQARLFSAERTAREHLAVFEEAARAYPPRRYYYYRLPWVDPVYKALLLYRRVGGWITRRPSGEK
jgi:glycosyltransferase involved in cell wall biosynthesis